MDYASNRLDRSQIISPRTPIEYLVIGDNHGAVQLCKQRIKIMWEEDLNCNDNSLETMEETMEEEAKVRRQGRGTAQETGCKRLLKR